MRNKLLILAIAVVVGLSATLSAEVGDQTTANGLVTTSDGTTITVLSQPKGQVTIQTDTNTIIRKQGQRITAAQITPGDFVNCLGTQLAANTMKASQIEVRGESKK